ncbi:hypothetical protein ELH48_09435 [Rhizobium ruizarguesonis]|uniref:hypothetical protein n=1 Tax=Rhizobium ruizarguesonis TaxID=2081791 RepID=UPI001030EA80|nr:hypothetical protein [Rhizobium ruizarguesonis]TBB27355.1 hypothetical protein ELH48_09435 [Rhizobium ruizarguesonis]TBB44237.1 hypothetical protein ELH49_09425 [Rhizobium ruizarguesonis]
MSDEYRPLYKWRETWLGEGHQDFSGFDEEQSFGRIQLDQTSHTKMGMWKWNATHVPWVRQHIVPHSGWEATSREACRRVEEHYEKLLALHGRADGRTN